MEGQDTNTSSPPKAQQKDGGDRNESENQKSNGAEANLTKRRGRNDQDHRNFECSCGKAYLSYPALYTHIKQKHDGVVRIKITKNLQKYLKKFQMNSYYCSPLIYPLKQRNRLPKTSKYREMEKLDEGALKYFFLFKFPQSKQTNFFPQIFFQKQRENPDINDSQDQENYSEDEEEASGLIQQMLSYFYEQYGDCLLEGNMKPNGSENIPSIFPQNICSNEQKNESLFEGIQQKYREIIVNNFEEKNLSKQQYSSLQCNQIFAIFLYKLSKQMNTDMLREIAFFIALYRRILNQHGYKLMNREQESKEKREFCESNNAKDILEVANPFIVDFLPQYLQEYNIVSFQVINKKSLDTDLFLRVTQFFANWLFIKRFTSTKIQVNDEEQDLQNHKEQENSYTMVVNPSVLQNGINNNINNINNNNINISNNDNINNSSHLNADGNSLNHNYVNNNQSNGNSNNNGHIFNQFHQNNLFSNNIDFQMLDK